MHRFTRRVYRGLQDMGFGVWGFGYRGRSSMPHAVCGSHVGS